MSKSYITHTEAFLKKGITSGGSNDYSTKSWLESNGFTVQSSLGRNYQNTEFVIDDDIIMPSYAEIKIRYPNTYGCFGTLDQNVINTLSLVQLYSQSGDLLQTWDSFEAGELYWYSGQETSEIYTLRITFNQSGTSIQELFTGIYIESIPSTIFQSIPNLQNAKSVFQGTTFNNQIPNYLFQYNTNLKSNVNKKVPLLFNGTYPNLTNVSKLFQNTGGGTGFDNFGIDTLPVDKYFSTSNENEWVNYTQYNTNFDLFSGCTNVSDFSNMFEGNKFSIAPCGIFDSVVDSDSMNFTECFKDCSNLEEFQANHWNFYNLGNPVHGGETSAIPASVGQGKTINITSCFSGCSLLRRVGCYKVQPTGTSAGGIFTYTYNNSSYLYGTGSPMFGGGGNLGQERPLAIEDSNNIVIPDHCFQGCINLDDYSTINNTYK